MRWHYGKEHGTGRVLARRLPDGRHYLYIRLFGQHRLVF